MSVSTKANPSREKILMITAGILLVLVVVPMLYWLFFSSVGELKNRHEELASRLEEQELIVEISRRSQKRLQEAAELSLPPSNDIAASLYQNWLLEQAALAGFRDKRVEHNTTRSVQDAFENFTFTVRGEASLEELSRFLAAFYSVRHLHLIRTLSLKPVEESRRMDVTVTVEAVGLSQAESSQKLAMEPIGSSAEAIQERLSRNIADRAIFSAYRPPAPDIPPPADPAPFDPSPYSYVSGIVWINDRPQVWIDLRTEGRKLKLSEGERFRVGVVDCRVRRIDEKTVLVEAAGALYAIELGDSFADAAWIGDLDDESSPEEVSAHFPVLPEETSR
jgi:hypothetical protein